MHTDSVPASSSVLYVYEKITAYIFGCKKQEKIHSCDAKQVFDTRSASLNYIPLSQSKISDACEMASSISVDP